MFARAREKARQTSCLSNLKQIGLAVTAYCQDYDETLPPFGYYVGGPPPSGGVQVLWDIIGPYLGHGTRKRHIELCPSDPSGAVKESAASAGLPDTSYGNNNQVLVMPWPVAWPLGTTPRLVSPPGLAMIPYPSATTLLYDGWSDTGAAGSLRTAYRHNEGANGVFVDGHGKWYGRTAPPASYLPHVWHGIPQ